MDKSAELIYSLLNQSDEPKAVEFLAQWRKAFAPERPPVVD